MNPADNNPILSSTAKLAPEQEHADVPGNDQGKTIRFCEALGGKAEEDLAEKVFGQIPGGKGLVTEIGRSCH
ncbi:MAG: hypothetical protein KGL39_41410 [Patescibacteria group bacterium]|nr:hypothetical protein [Patescibacteria group bacterium]